MAILNLEVEIDYNFQLIAISSNQKVHTLCWAINNMLSANLKLVEGHAINVKKRSVQFRKYISNESGFYFSLLCNKNLNSRLLPEISTVDFVIKIYDDDSPYSEAEIISKLRRLKEVQAVYSLEVLKLKSRQALIYD